MKKNRVQVVSILLLISLLLTGCNGWKNYFHTDTSLKNEAKKALEEKYDEEFIIHDVWTMSQTMFYATCSPEDEQDIVFEAKVYKDGRGVYADEYIQGAVSKQLEEQLRPQIEEVFGECFVKVTFAFVGQNYDYYEGVTIEEYYELYEEVDPYIQVFVNMKNPQYNKDIALKEYECLEKMSDGKIILDAGCRCYFLDDISMKACKEYFKEDSKERGGSAVFKELRYFGFGFNSGQINKTFEEYDEIRREINTNE